MALLIVVGIALIIGLIKLVKNNHFISPAKEAETARAAGTNLQKQTAASGQTKSERLAKVRNHPAARQIFQKLISYVNEKKTSLTNYSLTGPRTLYLCITVTPRHVRFRDRVVENDATSMRVFLRNEGSYYDEWHNFSDFGLNELTDVQLPVFLDAICAELREETGLTGIKTETVSAGLQYLIYADISSWCKRQVTTDLF